MRILNPAPRCRDGLPKGGALSSVTGPRAALEGWEEFGLAVDVKLPGMQTRGLDVAQEHAETNTGTAPIHAVLVELKEPRAPVIAAGRLGTYTY